MYNFCNMCEYNYFRNNPYNMCPYCNCFNPQMYRTTPDEDCLMRLKDYGQSPFVIDINEATKENNTYRTALWTGENLQVTLMSIDVNDDIGLEIHPDTDQFIRIEEGTALVKMGDRKDNLDYEKEVSDDFAIMIPAGKWHNVINTGNRPLKLYAIYAPPEHGKGTVHETKAIAEASEK